MKKYSQGLEDFVIRQYFKGQTGTLLSIGENNGKDLSNCLALIEENNFNGVLIEPSKKVYADLCGLHLHRDNIYCFNLAISDFNGHAKFWDSDTHLHKGDKALLSSLHQEEIQRWGTTTTFDETDVDVSDFPTFLEKSPYQKFDFISTDAEGCDLTILRQMNLHNLGCKCICAEHNSKKDAIAEIKRICATFGLNNVLLHNMENLVIAV